MARSKYVYLVYAKIADDESEHLVGAYTVKYQSENCTEMNLRRGVYNHLNHSGFVRYRVPDGNYHVGKIPERTEMEWESCIELGTARRRGIGGAK